MKYFLTLKSARSTINLAFIGSNMKELVAVQKTSTGIPGVIHLVEVGTQTRQVSQEDLEQIFGNLGGRGGMGGFSDFFETIFGGRGQAPGTGFEGQRVQRSSVDAIQNIRLKSRWKKHIEGPNDSWNGKEGEKLRQKFPLGLRMVPRYACEGKEPLEEQEVNQGTFS